MAPGTHVSSGVAQASIVSPPGSGTGAQLACFNGSGVCGGVWAATSSPPASSGTRRRRARVIRRRRSLASPPSSASTSSIRLCAAPSAGNDQGADDELRALHDRRRRGRHAAVEQPGHGRDQPQRLLRRRSPRRTHSTTRSRRRLSPRPASSAVFTGSVPDISKPFRVTLAWTDAPGPTTGNAFVNNLDLEVTIGGNTYKGNVFSGAFSATGGTADTRNNVESVFIPAGVSGSLHHQGQGNQHRRGRRARRRQSARPGLRARCV